MVWHFCGKTSNDKLEKIQERALKIVYKDYQSSYDELLAMANVNFLLVTRLRLIFFETYKCVKKVNADCINEMYHAKEMKYNLRKDVSLLQAKKTTTTFGLRSVSYVGAKLWNDNPSKFCDISAVGPINVVSSAKFIDNSYVRNSSIPLV